MQRALGISVHTGWGACVVVGGSLRRPEIIANEIVELLDDSERFCFHRAAEMERSAAASWIARIRKIATAKAKAALAPLLSNGVRICAVVAKDGEPGDLDAVLASHPRIHTAEGCFYRDVFREASTVPVRLVAPTTLDAAAVGKLAAPPWGRDQKLAALAAWVALES
jgi:hypothetical protein